MYALAVERAISYIEEQIGEDLSPVDVAEYVGFSFYHFHRIFKAMLGESISHYIKGRRLTRAAADLQRTKQTVTEIALNCAFDSPEAFGRAFRKRFRCSPSEYRKQRGSSLLLEKPILLARNLDHRKGGSTMQPKIVWKEKFTVVGLEYHGSNSQGEIPALWDSLSPLVDAIPGIKKNSVGLCQYVPNLTSETAFWYIAGMEVESLETLPEGMVCREVPSGRYAVFTHKGTTETLGITYNYIYGTWALTTTEELDERDDFEYYDERFLDPGDENSEMDIYIPIKG